jgi:NADPH:quinone reductase
MKRFCVQGPADVKLGSLQPIVRNIGKVPPVGEDEVRVAIEYVGVNYADVFMRSGRYPLADYDKPYMVPGVEVAGRVTKVGKGVTHLKPGDRVCSVSPHNQAYADSIVLPAHYPVKLNDEVGLDTGAAMVMGLYTMVHNIENAAKLQPGEDILIHAGAGGMGCYAIQLAKHLGAGNIYATVGSDENARFVESLGAIPINYNKEDFAEVVNARGGVDVVVDVIGAPYLERNVEILREGGRLRMISFKGTKEQSVAHTHNNIVLSGMLTGDYEFFTDGVSVDKQELLRELRDPRAADDKITLKDLIQSGDCGRGMEGAMTLGGDRVRQLSFEEMTRLNRQVGEYINQGIIKPIVYDRGGEAAIYPLTVKGINQAHEAIRGKHVGKILLQNTSVRHK